MVKGEIGQLRNLIESLEGAIYGNNHELMYDYMAQAEALYSTAIPELPEAFEMATNNSGLALRQSQIMVQLMKRYLMRIEEAENGQFFIPEDKHAEGVIHMSVQEFKQNVYRVIVSVLKMPDASPKVLAEKCSLSLPAFYEALEFAQRENLITGVRFSKGGHGRTPLAAFFDKATSTMKGLEFMTQFETTGTPQLQEMERPTVFISYNQNSGTAFADSLEQSLSACAIVLRDTTTMGAWDSFSGFMKNIRKQDFAVLVITPDYLRSEACMFEVSELMKDDNWQSKVMFAVLDSNIYSGGPSEYIQYWQNRENALKEQARNIDPKNMAPITNSLNKVNDIQRCFGSFYEAICDSNNPKLWEIKDRIIDRIRTTVNSSFAEGLDNSEFAAEIENQIQRLLD